ncbi:MAG: BMP family ABC transporter substrate-binding protein [Spirochaetales bacterium]|nr:BMP family ABC transporter substrate-binding protein [Spirochaetales bacterium]
MKRCLFFVFMISALLCGCSRRNSLLKSATDQNLKVGFIYNGKINDKGYTQAQDASRIELERKGVRTMYVENVPETEVCEAVIKELIKQGCKMIFATSLGYEKHVELVAAKFPEVKFAQCYGDNVKRNLSCYSGRTYEARYLAGIVAGLKTNANKIGYVAAEATPACIRDINAFTLGVKSVNPDASVYVRWTNALNNLNEIEYRTEELLILGCDILTQQLNDSSLYKVAKEKGAFVICNNLPVPEMAPDSYLTTVCCNWEVFVLDEVQRYLEGNWESRFYWEGLSSGTVGLSELSKQCVPGTKQAVAEAARKIISGELNVFAGPIYGNNQEEKLEEGMELRFHDLWYMDWFVDGVKVNQY